METRKYHIENLINDARSYLEAREQLAKLKMAEKGAHAAANLMSWLLIISVFLCVFVFAGIALAHVFEQLAGSEVAGYISVTLLYAVVGFLLVRFRNTALVKPLMDSIIQQLFSKEDHDND